MYRLMYSLSLTSSGISSSLLSLGKTGARPTFFNDDDDDDDDDERMKLVNDTINTIAPHTTINAMIMMIVFLISAHVIDKVSSCDVLIIMIIITITIIIIAIIIIIIIPNIIIKFIISFC